MSLIEFMSTKTGRLLRSLAGMALIIVGFGFGGGWLPLSVLGLIPLLAEVLNAGMRAPFLSMTLKGR